MSTESYQEIIRRNLQVDPETGEHESWRVCVLRLSASAAALPQVTAERDEAKRDIDRITVQCRKEQDLRRRAQYIMAKMGTWLFATAMLCIGGWAWALYQHAQLP